MKKVFQNSELAHVWAKQTQDEGRNPSNTYYFIGTRIYSYGSHFCIADINNINGKEIVFFTNRSYSNTTAKHINQVRQAISHKEIFYVYNPEKIKLYNSAFWQNIQKWYNKAIENLENVNKPRLRAHTIVKLKTEAAIELQNINKFIALFGLTIDTLKNKSEYNGKQFDNIQFKQIKEAVKGLHNILTNEDSDILTAHKKVVEKRAKEHLKKEAAKKKEQLIKANENLQLWLKGEQADTYSFHFLPQIYLRAIPQDKANKIQSSMGATVTLKEGKVLYKAIKGGKNIHGFVIDGYTVTEHTKDHVKIGCHLLLKTEIERFANLMNW